jgi:hypothetical protein
MGSSKMENFFGSLPSESGPEESLSELLAVFFLDVLEVWNKKNKIYFSIFIFQTASNDI